MSKMLWRSVCIKTFLSNGCCEWIKSVKHLLRMFFFHGCTRRLTMDFTWIMVDHTVLTQVWRLTKLKVSRWFHRYVSLADQDFGILWKHLCVCCCLGFSVFTFLKSLKIIVNTNLHRPVDDIMCHSRNTAQTSGRHNVSLTEHWIYK